MLSDSAAGLSALIVGCGSIGRRHARVLRSLGLRDLRACDLSAEQRAALAAEGPVRAQFDSFGAGLAAKPDTVFICTPPSLHVGMAVQALDGGCHVFCEKPLSSGLDGLDALERAIVRSGRLFTVGFCLRYHEGLTVARRHLEAGRIGRLVSMRLRVGENIAEVRPDYRSLFTLREVGAYDLTHEIDLACWFAGRPLRTMHALHGALSDLGFTAPDVAELILGFGDVLASVHLDLFSSPRTRLTELLGTRGTITVELADWNRCTVSLFEAAAGRWERQELATERDAMFRAEDTEFLEAAAAGAAAAGVSLAEARKSLEIVVRALEGR